MIEWIILSVLLGALSGYLEKRQKKVEKRYEQVTVLRHYPDGNVSVSSYGTWPIAYDLIPPPEVCAEVVYAMYQDIRLGYRILSNYYGIPPPLVVFGSGYLKSRGVDGLHCNGTIYLKDNPQLSTCLHEFYHYLARCQGWSYSRDEEEYAETFASQIISNAYEFGMR